MTGWPATVTFRPYRVVPVALLLVLMLLGPLSEFALPGHPVTAQAGGWWRPEPGLDWQMQLTGEPDLDHGRDVFFLDLFAAQDVVSAQLRERGTRIVCYFSAGSYEDWREDAATFPPRIVGDPMIGWEGEWWLDIRQPELRPIIERRLDLAVTRGCDGVDPDNVDGFANPTGFSLSNDDQLAFNRWLAGAAHDRGLAIGLKNDLDQIPALVEDFDWQVNEQCAEFDECGVLLPFIEHGKPVFGLEYPAEARQSLEARAEEVCPDANRLGLDTIVKPYDLTAPRVVCRGFHDEPAAPVEELERTTQRSA